MAEAVLFDIAARIIAKLGSSVLKEIGLLWGLEDELKKLNDSITMIQAVLLDAEKQSSKNNQVKTWLGMLKEAVYDADDLIDLVSTHALRKETISRTKFGKKVRLFFSRSNQFAYAHKMAHKIQSIREQIDEIAKNEKFMLDVRPVENVGWNTRETHSSLPHIFVGRENEKEEIMKVLLGPSKNNVFVISILGIGGLGKTALAQLLFEEVKNQFELKEWVCVGENFNKKSIVEKILGRVNGSKPENLELESLKNQLFQSINGKRYLVVLDDVWDENLVECSDLMDLLAKGAKGSRVIITTRLRSVARVARSDVEYELKGLSYDESWDLFKTMAFVEGDVPSSSFEEIGKEIVVMLNGVPLVIKTIGGLLYSKRSEDEWRSFKDGELSTVWQREDNNILPTLRLSYNHLPSHLKNCFAYCRLFPKDYEIDVEKLIELWIAQGFVRSSNVTQSLTDIGLQYFKELLWRSFFQGVEEDGFGNIHTCGMHDLMHDLAISVAGVEATSLNSKDSSLDDKTRHVSINFELKHTKQDILSLCNASKARTFLLVNQSESEEDVKIGKEEWNLVFSKLKCLRALDLHSMGIESVPRSIHKLELLTYLDVSYNNAIKKLPNSICRLLNLQVLKVDSCSSLEELPKDIRKLVKLRCLSLFSCYRLTHMPCGIGQLTGLETLSLFVVDKKGRGAELGELKNLRNLRGRLRIRNMRYVKNPAFEFQTLNLKERSHLLNLELYWNNHEDDNKLFDAKDTEGDEMAMDVLQPHCNLKFLRLSYYKGAKFSSWLYSVTNLVKLYLVCCTNIQSLPSFDQFPSLQIFHLNGLTKLEYVEIGTSCNNGRLPLFFPSLKELYICECPNLKGWVRFGETESSELPNFHCLSSLGIYGCPNLNSMPHSPSIGRLHFQCKSMKQVEQLLEANISAAEHNSSPPLSQLHDVTVEGIEEEAVLAEELQQKLTSLTTLSIDSSPGIMGMECPPFGRLKGLRNLHFWNMEMEFLPKWLHHLSTLNYLQFFNCPNLASLSDEMRDLTSLQYLDIRICPKLSERCRKMNGEDWPNIAHIPNIGVDGSMEQGTDTTRQSYMIVVTLYQRYLLDSERN